MIGRMTELEYGEVNEGRLS